MGTTPGRVQRPAAIGFAVLVLATGAAFLFANQLKSAPAEIKVIKRNQFFSPNGDGRRDTEPIIFTIDQKGSAAVDIVDADGTAVRRIHEDISLREGKRKRVVWDGLQDDGDVAPDGEYQMRLILGEGRSLLAPRPFFLDTKPPDPELTIAGEAPNTIVTPGTSVDFSHTDEEEVRLPAEFKILRTDVTPARPVATVPGELGRSDYTWDGDTDAGIPAPPGTYLIQVTAYDRAQNPAQVPELPIDGPVDSRTGVTVRTLAVQPPARSVPDRRPDQHPRRRAGQRLRLVRAPARGAREGRGGLAARPARRTCSSMRPTEPPASTCSRSASASRWPGRRSRSGRVPTTTCSSCCR